MEYKKVITHLVWHNATSSISAEITMSLPRTLAVLATLMALAIWRPVTAAAFEPVAGEDGSISAQTLMGPDCQLLSSSPNGFLAVASQAKGMPPPTTANQRGVRAVCSASDNNSCNLQCINSGWRGGYCCCTCGTVSLCTCYR